MNNLKQPFNPRLSDFTEAQIRTVMILLVQEETRLELHISSLQKYVPRMMKNEIKCFRQDLEAVREIWNQFYGALQVKEAEQRIADN